MQNTERVMDRRKNVKKRRTSNVATETNDVRNVDKESFTKKRKSISLVMSKHRKQKGHSMSY